MTTPGKMISGTSMKLVLHTAAVRASKYIFLTHSGAKWSSKKSHTQQDAGSLF